MTTEKIAGHRVEIFDSIDDLPVIRFHKYNKFMLIDSGVGSDLRDINTHISKIKAYFDKDKVLAFKELDNLRQNLYMISEEISPRYLAFAALVKSIDGREVFDLSDDNLKKISKQLSTIKVSKLEKLITLLKKKLIPN